MEKAFLVTIVHSQHDNEVFLSGKALLDISKDDVLYFESKSNPITIKRIEMYRKDVDAIPQAYGADITLIVNSKTKLQKRDVLHREHSN